MSYRRKNKRDAPPPQLKTEFEANWNNKVDDFESMNLRPELIHGIYSYGFKHPSDIQSLAISPIVDKRNVIAQAQSGTGKTGAFGIGVLQNIVTEETTTQGLVLAPTRELATQTYEFMKEVGNRIPRIRIELFTGGHAQSEDQNKAASLPHVAVGTPGRILDLITTGHLRCENLAIVVLDEADELLGEGFLEQIQQIFAYYPQGVQILLFSATIPVTAYAIMEQFMQDPVKILVKAEQLTLEGIKQFFVNVGEPTNKLPTLIDILGRLAIQKAVIFANKKENVEYLKAQMEAQDYTVSAIHGALSQKERDQIMVQFRLGASRVLIATDLIARGIDVQQVTLVINFELSNNKENYLHRIGRSGRYGRKGIAINICDQREMGMIDQLQRHYHTVINELSDNISELLNEANNSETFAQ